MSESPRQKLQNLLRELFQFDSTDLDFGIYRIMNLRRAELQRFINKDLLDAVAKGFEEIKKGESQDILEELTGLKDEIAKTLEIDAEKEIPAAFQNTPVVKRYVAKKAELADVKVSEELEAELFSDIYTFFSRYWDDGDFISKRRYSRDAKYAIPYNGEEVALYWANHDQYYIKTAEYFNDYTFKTDSYAVHFKIATAQTEQNNVKGEKRFFLLHDGEDNITLIDAGGNLKDLMIRFQFRPLTDQEAITYGKQKQQEKISEAICQKVLVGIDDPRLKGLLSTVKEGEEKSLLAKHLYRYTKKNTSDYFIHKDLKGFLERELDFFIKNEVMMLDAIGTDNEVHFEKYLTKVKVLKQVCVKIIAFLAQLEDFQKRLFEKRKFVLETNYCMTLDNVPEEFYDDILENEDQLNAWKELFALPIDANKKLLLPPEMEEQKAARRSKKRGQEALGLKSEPVKMSKGWLKKNQTLLIDTRWFEEDFKDQLLSCIGDIGKEVDGLLIKGENFQAQELLLKAYRGRVGCIYIDPPFNTGGDDFIYKDNYQYSTWLALMEDRLRIAKEFLQDNGTIAVSIDNNEIEHLLTLLDKVFGRENRKNIITVKRGSVTGPKVINPGVVNVTEYVILYSRQPNWKPNRVFRKRERDTRYSGFIINRDQDPRNWQFTSLLQAFAISLKVQTRQVKKVLGKEFDEKLNEFVNSNAGSVYQFASLDEDKISEEALELKKRSEAKPDEIFHFKREGLDDWYVKDGKRFLFFSDRLVNIGGEIVQGELLTDIWDDTLPNDIHNEGGVVLKKGKKPEKLLGRIIELTTRKGDLVLDFFAGSGTSCAAAQKLGRRWIGVEVEEYFEPKLKRRMNYALNGESSGISSVTSWKGGGFFKYQAIESYEDTLNNIELNKGAQSAMFEDYTLRYMLDNESKGSAALLNVEKMSRPFNYELEVYEKGERKRKKVDLIETFNYLLGLEVNKIRTYRPKDDKERIYRAVFGTVNGKSVLVVWRNTDTLDLEADKLFIKKEISGNEAVDLLYINGDTFVPNAHSIEETFKAWMFAPLSV